ncbi:MAG: glycosyltransferase family 2 protein [Burkholderiales bacterium]|nr:glycosyltransferase family 2 protein [Burkholderiales bacterium]
MENAKSTTPQQLSKPKVCAIVVSFQPDLPHLLALLEKLKLQTSTVLVVDNGSVARQEIASAVMALGVHYLQLPSNIGLAAGFNRGIHWALQQHASHVILFDQDSLPTPSMLRQLLFAEKQILTMGLPLAALGPAYVDVKSHQMGAVIGPERWFTRRKYKPDFAMLIEAGYLISSGQLIRTSVLQKVGLMREELFIDAVDIEWSLRARQQGLRNFVVADALMQHNLGDAKLSIGKTEIALHSPLRHYYIIRNALLLCRMKHIPWRWKVVDFLKTVRRFFAYLVLCSPRWQHLIWMCRGWRDGLLGRDGPAQK